MLLRAGTPADVQIPGSGCCNAGLEGLHAIQAVHIRVFPQETPPLDKIAVMKANMDQDILTKISLHALDFW